MTTISKEGIFVYIATLIVVTFFIVVSVFYVPVEEWATKFGLFILAGLMFVIGTVGFHIRQ